MGPTSKIRSDLILEVFVAFPLAFPCARRAEDVAPYHMCARRGRPPKLGLT